MTETPIVCVGATIVLSQVFILASLIRYVPELADIQRLYMPPQTTVSSSRSQYIDFG
jgi:hypothetical protein